MYGYRTGAKQEHKNQIRQMTLAGVAAEEISRKLMIDINCVRKFCDYYRKQSEKDITPPVQKQETVINEPDPVDKPVNETGSAQIPEAETDDGTDAAPTGESLPEAEAEPPKKRSVGRPPKQQIA